MKGTANSGSGFNMTSSSGVGFKKQAFVSKPVDPVIMEEFRQVVVEVSTSDWNKRLKAIDMLTAFVF